MYIFLKQCKYHTINMIYSDCLLISLLFSIIESDCIYQPFLKLFVLQLYLYLVCLELIYQLPIKLSFGLFQSKMTDLTPAQSKQQFIYDYESPQQPSSPQQKPQLNMAEDLCIFSRKIEQINPEVVQVRSRRKQRSKKNHKNYQQKQSKDEQKLNGQKQENNTQSYLNKHIEEAKYQQQNNQNIGEEQSIQKYNIIEKKVQQPRGIHNIQGDYVYNENLQLDDSQQQQHQIKQQYRYQRQQRKINHPPKLQYKNQSNKMTKNNVSKATITTVDSLNQKTSFMRQSETLTVNSEFSGLKRNPVIIQDRYQNVITHVVPPGYRIPCYIKLQNRFFGLSCQYSLFLKQKNEVNLPILSAKKQLLKISSNFIISKNYQYSRISKRQSSCIGILKANFSGTQFKYFRKIIEVQDDNKQQLQELKTIINYQSSILGYKGPRNIEVVKTNPTIKPSFENSLEQIIGKHEKQKLEVINSVKPTKKTKNGMYIVDFQGKVKVPSGKNFILADKKGKQCLLLAKQSDDCFLMQVSYPLSIAEGFAICLSSLDSKLLCN